MNRMTCRHQTLPMTSRPLAARGLKSRYRLPFGFVMIGALDECRFSLILQRFPVLANYNRPAMCKVMAVPVIGLSSLA